jgi:hypothetical protein
LIRGIDGVPIAPSDIPPFQGELTENELGGTERRSSDDMHRTMLDLQSKLENFKPDQKSN